jgi:peptidoglycan hydrolase-like protein with peptidoglycan-binding domain
MILRRTLLISCLALSCGGAVAACSSSNKSGGSGTTTATESTPPGSEVLSTDSAPTTDAPSSSSSSTPTPTSTPAPTTTASCHNVPVVTDPVPTDLLIQLGDCGPGVSQVQTYLVNMGYTITVDGHYGPVTKSTIKGYQEARGALAITGNVDYMTFIDIRVQGGS